eukprot:1399034-Rhodomonas_salina.1
MTFCFPAAAAFKSLGDHTQVDSGPHNSLLRRSSPVLFFVTESQHSAQAATKCDEPCRALQLLLSDLDHEVHYLLWLPFTTCIYSFTVHLTNENGSRKVPLPALGYI